MLVSVRGRLSSAQVAPLPRPPRPRQPPVNAEAARTAVLLLLQLLIIARLLQTRHLERTMTRRTKQMPPHFILFFHGRDGREAPQALGNIRATTLPEALAILENVRATGTRTELLGTWCCSRAAASEPGGPPSHPEKCEHRYVETPDGQLSEPDMVN